MEEDFFTLKILRDRFVAPLAIDEGQIESTPGVGYGDYVYDQLADTVLEVTWNYEGRIDERKKVMYELRELYSLREGVV